MLLLLLGSPTLFNTTRFEWAHFLASLLFLPYPHPVLGVLQPFLFQGWVLNYFICFAAAFALFYKLPMTTRVAAMIALFSAVQVLALLAPHTSRFIDFYGSPIEIDFELGMIVALTYMSVNRLPLSVILIALAVSVILIAIGVHLGVAKGSDRTIYWGLSSVGLLTACIFIERQWGWPSIRLLSRLGDASYATYISGIFSLSLATLVLERTNFVSFGGRSTGLILLVASAFAGGVITHHGIEKPLAALL
jgi:exopolysaccharide production protein ExoZ